MCRAGVDPIACRVSGQGDTLKGTAAEKVRGPSPSWNTCSTCKLCLGSLRKNELSVKCYQNGLGVFLAQSWDALWMSNLNLDSAFVTPSATSSDHSVCHAPVKREDGLGTETLWLKILRWSWVEKGISHWSTADGAGTGDYSMTSKAASLNSGLLMSAHFNVFACPEIVRKSHKAPTGLKVLSESQRVLHVFLQFAPFKLLSLLQKQQQSYYEESFYTTC